MRSISILIPNYNGAGILPGAIESARKAAEHAGCRYEIIVSDDGSTDESVDHARKNYPSVTIITSAINAGFSAAVNRGIRQATGDLILIMNNDIVLEDDYFGTQFDFFDDEKTFGVMGKICHPFTKKIMDAAKYPALKLTQLVSTLNYIPAGIPSGFKIPTMFLSGANALVDRKKILLLGGMNEIYSPFYMEDVDLGVRAWRLGWRCYYDPAAVCYHYTSSTIRFHYSAKIIRMVSKRNKFIFHYFHLERLSRFFWYSETALNLLVRWLILDFQYYLSFNHFMKMLAVIRHTKTNFNITMKENNGSLSLKQVTDAMKKQVSGYDLEFF